MNGRFPIAIHIMTLLCAADKVILSSDYMAGSINVNPVLVRKELSNLIKHNLIISTQGKNGGYALSKSASEISLANIYSAVKSGTVLGKAKNQPNPACPIGKQIDSHLQDLEIDMERTMLNKLGNINLFDFCKKFK